MNEIVEIMPEAAFAWEADRLAEVAENPNGRHLKFWACPNALVVPRKLAALPVYEAAAKASAAAGWPVSVRGTGGDATPQGPGIVNVTHVYATPNGEKFDMGREYDRLCAPIEAALGPGANRGWMPGAFCDGAHNIQWDGLKFAGTALRLRRCKADKSRHAVLAHAILLITVPGAQTIDALNALLSDLGQDRVIDRAAHTGLPDHVSQGNFLDRLVASFAALEGITPAL